MPPAGGMGLTTDRSELAELLRAKTSEKDLNGQNDNPRNTEYKTLIKHLNQNK